MAKPSQSFIHQRQCDPRLASIIVDQTTLWNRPLAYLLSGVVFFGIGFAAAMGV